MSSQKKFQLTFRRTEELTVEVDAASESEARAVAFDLVSGKSQTATVHAAPKISVPETVDHNLTEWSVFKLVEMVMR